MDWHVNMSAATPDDNMNPAPLPENKMLDMLRATLSCTGPDGTMDPKAFWFFVAALAHGRGIAEKLRQAGLEEVKKVPEVVPDYVSNAGTFKQRQERAYHIGLLAQLVSDMRTTDGPTILPANFNHGAIGSDLLRMLDGPSRVGAGQPQMLYSLRTGLKTERANARRRLVGAVYWRVAHTGKTLVSIREELLPGVDKERWDKWLKEFDGQDGYLVQQARAAGAAGDKSSPYYMASAEKLAQITRLALA